MTLSDTPEYRAFHNMKSRCYNQNTPNYARYGARGIIICDRWLRSFDNFLADMGPRPGPEYSIDRIDNNGPYSPENCRWATLQEQNSNTRRNVYVDATDRAVTVSEHCRSVNVRRHLVSDRLKKGLSLEDAVAEASVVQEEVNREHDKQIYSFNGEEKTLREWSKDLNVPYSTLHHRLTVLNWSTEKSFTYRRGGS